MRTMKLLNILMIIAILGLSLMATRPVQANSETITPASSYPCPVYTAKYFNNMTLTGSPAAIVCEDEIDHDWGSSGPGYGIGEDQFSARWLRYVRLQRGTYIFHIETDDGVKVWLDGKLILDQWVDQAVTTYEIEKVFTVATSHSIRIDWYENGGDAVIRFWWYRVP